MTVVVRPCTANDLEVAAAGAGTRQEADHFRERFSWQQAQEAILLLAWDGDRVAGRATLTLTSKYPQVRARHPRLAEVNALAADPTGQGTGTALLSAAISTCRERGIPEIGLAVEAGGPAERLYQRFGFEAWQGGTVIDEWTQILDDGTAIEHADPCDYLLRPVG